MFQVERSDEVLAVSLFGMERTLECFGAMNTRNLQGRLELVFEQCEHVQFV